MNSKTLSTGRNAFSSPPQRKVVYVGVCTCARCLVVGLSAGLHEKLLDFHEIWVEDESRHRIDPIDLNTCGLPGFPNQQQGTMLEPLLPESRLLSVLTSRLTVAALPHSNTPFHYTFLWRRLHHPNSPSSLIECDTEEKRGFGRSIFNFRSSFNNLSFNGLWYSLLWLEKNVSFTVKDIDGSVKIQREKTYKVCFVFKQPGC